MDCHNYNWILLSTLLSLILVFHESSALSTMAIDLGTEFMKVAIVKPGVPMEIALDKESSRKTPTIVSIRNGERLFGNPALTTAVKFPSKSFPYVMTIIGKPLDHPAVKLYRKRFPYVSLAQDDNGQLFFKHDEGTDYSAEEILGMLLENARSTAESFSGQPMKDAVIVVPSFFSQAERRAVIRAAKLVDLNVIQLMNDNTAVALNYGIFRRKFFNATAQYYAFYDIGASSTVASIVSYQTVKVKEYGMMEEQPQLTLIGVGYDAALGALDFTLRLRDHLAKAFNDMKKTKKDVFTDYRAMAKLFKEAQRVMKVLSANNDIHAQIENLMSDQDFKFKVTRADFENMCSDLFDRVKEPLESALSAAQIPFPLVKEIILMGGGSRFPKLQETLIKVSGKSDLGKSVNTDEAAALGAVYQAAFKSPGFRVKKFIIKDATLYPIQVDFERVKSTDGKQVVSRVQRYLFNYMHNFPQKKVLTFNKQSVDFDFYVSYGKPESMPSLETRGFTNLTHVHLLGVTAAHEKHLTKTAPVPSKEEGKEEGPEEPTVTANGVKAHFSVDDSGIFQLISVEALFTKSPAQAAADKDAEQSAFQKLGKTFSNFFGSTEEKKDAEKKDEEKKEDEKKPEEKETVKKSDDSSKNKKSVEEKPEADNTTSSNTTADAKSENKTENGTKEAKSDKPVLVSEPIKFKVTVLDMPEPDGASISASIKKLKEWRAKDEAIQLLEKSRNELESFVFENKDRIYRDEYTLCSTEEQREVIMKKLSEVGDWYDEQGPDTLATEFISKLTSLKTVMSDLEKRVKEKKDRPIAFKKLADALNTSQVFVDGMVNFTGEGKVFTQVEVDGLLKVISSVKIWQADRLAEMKTMKLTEPPPFLAAEVDPQIENLHRELRYLVTKLEIWKTSPPPPPKKNDTIPADNTTTADSSTSDQSKPSDKPKDTPDKKDSESNTFTPDADAQDGESNTFKPDADASKDPSKSENIVKDEETKDSQKTDKSESNEKGKKGPPHDETEL